MQRRVVPVLCLGMCSCLGPLESDRPGYSRHVLPKGTQVPLASEDYEANHKVDMNDGLEAGPVALKSGFAQGLPVDYWDLGLAKGSVAPAYVLVRCDDKRVPLPDGELDHPWIWDSAPGDPDYSPFRALYPVCVTKDYDGELIPSSEALSDAIDMRLVRDPLPPMRWLNIPMIASGVQLNAEFVSRHALVGSHLYDCLTLETQEGYLPYVDKRIATKNVYELSFDGSEKIERVVFAQTLLDPSGQPNPAYAPAWKVIAVKIAKGSDLAPFDRESALVTVDEKGGVKPAAEQVVSAKASGATVNRPHRVPGEELQ